MKMSHNIKLSTKIALAFATIIFLISIAILLFINITVQNSMKKQPIIKSITPNMISITIDQDVKNKLSYSLPVASEEFMEQLKNTEMNANRYDQIFRVEVLARIMKYSFLAAIFIGMISFFLSNQITKKLMRPLTEMVKVTQTITLQNLNERINLPESNDETTKLISVFNKTLDRLQGAFTDLDEFNAYASHELRNSLAILRACLEEIESNQENKASIEQALKYMTKLSRTVDDIMVISSRQLKDEGEYVDLALLAAQAADEYLVTNRKIYLDIPEEGVQPVYGKELWLYRVIYNLLDNAVKNSQSNSNINIRLRQHHEAVVLEIEDEGTGIDEANMERIWKPYYSKPLPGKKGFGLGLTIVYHVINTLGGIVWVESIIGKGTSFYISLPVSDY